MTNAVLGIMQSTPARWSLAIGWSLLLTLLLLQPEADPLIDLGLPGGQSLGREILFSALHLLAFALTCYPMVLDPAQRPPLARQFTCLSPYRSSARHQHRGTAELDA